MIVDLKNASKQAKEECFLITLGTLLDSELKMGIREFVSFFSPRELLAIHGEIYRRNEMSKNHVQKTSF